MVMEKAKPQLDTGSRQTLATAVIISRRLFWPEGVKKAPLSIMSPSDLQFQLFQSSNPVKRSRQVDDHVLIKDDPQRLFLDDTIAERAWNWVYRVIIVRICHHIEVTVSSPHGIASKPNCAIS
ncbi:hypothetical protein SADUNF_Sadunf11G0068100 [Salix dunnii]|uniref:Uncharacterized protein n=1 Tax=Salix dunnii TaxID=1413687 RepID=A0A835JK30_9ROSI|nr:hypothetical protein SADUNF_Sadunf11G0068100 [Salix dunnii]